MPETDERVQLATVGAAHGVRGEVRVKSFTEDPLSLGAYGPLTTGGGRRLVVTAVRQADEMVVARFEGVETREAAAALTGEPLFVARSVLPADLEEDEYYQADLVGLSAVDAAGAAVGEVIAVHDFGAGTVLELRPAAGPTLMIPFTREAVPQVDPAAGQLRVDLAAAGIEAPRAPSDRKKP